MKVSVEFNFDEYEDRLAHKRFTYTLELCFVINELDNYLRGELKYNESLHKKAYEALEKTRNKLHEILNENNINLQELSN